MADTSGEYQFRGQHPNRDRFLLEFRRLDGQLLASFQFDTLETAVDQADVSAGIRPAEWRNCQIDVTERERWCEFPSSFA